MATYIDISHWNKITDWSKIKANCPFVILKATQGTSSVDEALETNIKQCEAKGIPYWLYCYLNKGNEKAQAEFLVKTGSAKAGSHLVGYVLDVEAGSTAAGVQEALDYLAGATSKCMIYTMYSQFSTYSSVINGRPSTCAWWEARYGKDTGSYDSAYPCHSGADLHQYTSKGTVDGAESPIDLSRICGSKNESWFKTTTGATGSTSTSTSAATATGTYKAGDKVTLSNIALYESASATKKSNTLTGTYYIWNATTSNGRIRITNSTANVGVSGKITGWINVSDISGTASSSGTAATSTVKASAAAKAKNNSLAGTYTVTAKNGLNIRDEAGDGSKVKVLVAIPYGQTVQNYGYYTTVGSTRWLYIQTTYNKVTYEGFCSEAYLKKT